MSVTITNLELNPGEILESVCKRPAARQSLHGTGLIRVDVTSPCSLYIRGEDGFRLVISDAESRSDDEWVSEFLHEGMTASYHYADDSGKEWDLGSAARDRALAIYEKRPEPEPPGGLEPVAYLHENRNRSDVITKEVKKLLHDAAQSCDYLHRPIDKSEHYTEPLVLQSAALAMLAEKGALIQRQAALIEKCRDALVYENPLAWSGLLKRIEKELSHG